MTSQIHLWPEAIEETAESLVVGATIESPDQTRSRLWYRLPIQHRSAVSRNADPFAIATLMLAMRRAADLVIHGTVSPSLLQNLEEFQAAWVAWRPQQLTLVEILPEKEQEREKQDVPPQAISAFSGGVDSAYTAFCHRTGRYGRRQRHLTAGMMAHGFDIPIDETQDFDQAAQRSAAMLSSLGMELIPVATNFRQVIPIPWEDVFGMATAACLMLLQERFSEGLIAGSYSYSKLNFPYGSNPLSDRLLSSQSFAVIHDGAEHSRFHKMKVIKDWPEALQQLRVCWQGAQRDRNCGNCEKCIRNILNFRALGVGLPPCFEQDVSNRQIRQLRLKGASLTAIELLLQYVEEADAKEAWVTALETALWRNRARNTLGAVLPKTWKDKIRQVIG